MDRAGETKKAMNMQTWERTVRPLGWSIGLLSGLLVLLFLVTALRRLRFPYELEQLEGNVFMGILRVAQGKPLYVRPGMQYIPYMYAPGYFYAAALLSRLTGLTLATARLLSIVSTLGCFATIFLLVYTECRRALPALAAVGLYAGSYTVCQEWFDLGRLDSFFVFLVLLALLATRRSHPILAALLWVLAFQSKQSILPVACVMMLSCWPDRRRLITGLAALTAGVAGSVLWLNHVTHGWYWFYVFAVPGANADLKARTAVMFWPADMLRPFALAVALIVVALVWTPPRPGSRATRFYLAAGTILPLFWWIRTHSGSTSNSLMPIYAFLAVLFGIAVGRMLRRLEQSDAYQPKLIALLLLLVSLQLAAGVYNPGDFVPPPGRVAQFKRLIAEIKAAPGDPLVLEHPYYDLLAGKPTHADLTGVHDVLGVKNPAIQTALRADLLATLQQPDACLVVLDHADSWSTVGDLLAGDSDANSSAVPGQIATGEPENVLPHWFFNRCPR